MIFNGIYAFMSVFSVCVCKKRVNPSKGSSFKNVQWKLHCQLKYFVALQIF